MSARFTPYPGQAMAEAITATFDDRVEIAAQIADEARSSAPVLTGDYLDGIGTEVDGDRVFVVNDDEDAIYKEYGTADTPPHATLTNAARQYGEYVGWEPR